MDGEKNIYLSGRRPRSALLEIQRARLDGRAGYIRDEFGPGKRNLCPRKRRNERKIVAAEFRETNRRRKFRSRFRPTYYLPTRGYTRYICESFRRVPRPSRPADVRAFGPVDFRRVLDRDKRAPVHQSLAGK